METILNRTEIGDWKIQEILSRNDAVTYGSNRGWCTANDDYSYNMSYNKDKGDLFILFKGEKKRAHSQIFFSKMGAIEYRKPFNKHVDPYQFFSEEGEGRELSEWFHDRRYEQRTIHNVLRPEISDTRINGINYMGTNTGRINVDMTTQNLQMSGTFSELPDVAAPGTIMFVNETNTMHVFDGEQWQEIQSNSVEYNMVSNEQLSVFGRSTHSETLRGSTETNVNADMPIELVQKIQENIKE